MFRFRRKYEVAAMQMIDFNQYMQNQRMYGDCLSTKWDDEKMREDSRILQEKEGAGSVY